MRSRTAKLLIAAVSGVLSFGISKASADLLYNPVVTLVGNGTNTISGAGTNTAIQVYNNSVANQAGPVAQSMYNNTGSGLVNVGNSTTEGALANNAAIADAAAAGVLPAAGTAAYVFSSGYGVADQTAGPAASSAASRVVGYMSVSGNSVSAGTIGATQTGATAYAGSNIRAAVGDNTATNFWTAGTATTGTNAGYRYFNSNTQLVASPGPTNTRAIQIRQGQLYGGSDTGAFVGISVIGNSASPFGAPATTAGQTATALFASGTGSSGTSGPLGFLLIKDPNNASTPTGVPFNIAYIADNGSGLPGIEKWTFNPGTATNNGWSLAYIINEATPVGFFGLSGQLVTSANPAQDSVVLWATNNLATANSLEQFTDPLGATTAAAANGSLLVLATAPTNEVFRGVAVAPISPTPEPGSLAVLGMAAMGLLARRRGERKC